MWARISLKAKNYMDSYEISFNPRAAVPEFESYELQRQADNLQALSARTDADVAYGDHPRRRLDIYRAANNPHGDVHVFFHGGYWRAGDKQSYAYLAKALTDRGVTVVVPNYELCGPSRFEDVADSALATFRWVLQHIADYGGSPGRITISGHSAGAYLCALLHSSDWHAQGFTDCDILGSILISGIYDPTKAIGTSVNQELGFTAGTARAFDLSQMPWSTIGPSYVVVGLLEPAEWIAMSRDYFRDVVQHSSPAGRYEPLPGHNHFSILNEYVPGGRLHTEIVQYHQRAPLRG